MRENRVVDALSYLSVLFLPVLFPLIVWAVAERGSETRATAAKAFWWHLVPAVVAIIVALIVGTGGLVTRDMEMTAWLTIILTVFIALAALVSYLYSIVKGIQILVRG